MGDVITDRAQCLSLAAASKEGRSTPCVCVCNNSKICRPAGRAWGDPILGTDLMAGN